MYAKNQYYYISDTSTWKSEGFDDTCYREREEKKKSHDVSCLDFGCLVTVTSMFTLSFVVVVAVAVAAAVIVKR